MVMLYMYPFFDFSMEFRKGIAALSILGFTTLGALPSHAFFGGCGTGSASGTIGDLPTSCLVGDKLYSDFSTDIPGTAIIQIAEVGATGKQHNLVVSGTPVGGTFFNYKITISGSSNYFLTWQTDASSAIAPNTFTISTTYTNSSAGTITLDKNSSSSGLKPFEKEPTTTDVTHSLTNSDTLNSFTDTVTQGPVDPVPAPLPMLGAAVVYGSVQRLRRSSKRLQALASNRG